MVRVERLRFDDASWGTVKLPGGELALKIGLGSGLASIPGEWGVVHAVTDRGPNIFVSTALELGLSHLAHLKDIRDAKILLTPDRGPEVVQLRVEGDSVRIVGSRALRTKAGRLSPCPPPGAGMERVFDIEGRELQPSGLGADTEAIAVLPGGALMAADEYAPSLLKVDGGVVTERWVAKGQEAMLRHPDLAVRGVLPAMAAKRRANRGIEGLAASADGAFLYAGLQSAAEGEDERSILVWKLDARTGAVLGEHAYPLDEPSTFRRDAARRKVGWGDLKISELTWIGEDRLIVLERIAHTTKLYLADFSGPAVSKRLLVSSDDHPEIGSDMEGVALLSPNELLMVSDNDFGVEGAATEFWRLTFDVALA